VTAPNHIIGGFTITGVFASIGGINILQDYRLLPVILIGCLLPDIDHTKSLIGRLFLPISRPLNRKYGHRTITHSLVAIIGLTALISAFQGAFFPDMKVAQVFCLAYGSHLLLDMVTVQGIPLFYPFKKNSCVLPGNPQMRIRTNSIRHETIAMCLFVVSAVFMKPLFADGFWTSYNRLFGTLQHIVSEYHKSEDLMKVTFTIQHGSETEEYLGLCVAVSSSDLTIIKRNKQFESFPKDGQMIKDIYPEHTKYLYSFEQGSYHDVTIDSVHRLFKTGKFTRFEIQGSRPFLYSEQGINNQKSVLKLDYPNKLILEEINDKKTIRYSHNPQITSKVEEIERIKVRDKGDKNQYTQKLQEYQDTKNQIETETDEIKKELLMIRFAKMKAPTPPKENTDKIKRLQSDIRQLQQSDDENYRTAVEAAKQAPLTFSGAYERLLINGKDI